MTMFEIHAFAKLTCSLLQIDIFLTSGLLYILYLQQYIACRIENDIVYVEAALCSAGDQFDIDSLKAVIACLYYQQFPTEKKSEGRQFLVYVFAIIIVIEDYQSISCSFTISVIFCFIYFVVFLFIYLFILFYFVIEFFLQFTIFSAEPDFTWLTLIYE
jgi:hypothetical protein